MDYSYGILHRAITAPSRTTNIREVAMKRTHVLSAVMVVPWALAVVASIAIAIAIYTVRSRQTHDLLHAMEGRPSMAAIDESINGLQAALQRSPFASRMACDAANKRLAALVDLREMGLYVPEPGDPVSLRLAMDRSQSALSNQRFSDALIVEEVRQNMELLATRSRDIRVVIALSEAKAMEDSSPIQAYFTVERAITDSPNPTHSCRMMADNYLRRLRLPNTDRDLLHALTIAKSLPNHAAAIDLLTTCVSKNLDASKPVLSLVNATTAELKRQLGSMQDRAIMVEVRSLDQSGPISPAHLRELVTGLNLLLLNSKYASPIVISLARKSLNSVCQTLEIAQDDSDHVEMVVASIVAETARTISPKESALDLGISTSVMKSLVTVDEFHSRVKAEVTRLVKETYPPLDVAVIEADLKKTLTYKRGDIVSVHDAKGRLYEGSLWEFDAVKVLIGGDYIYASDYGSEIRDILIPPIAKKLNETVTAYSRAREQFKVDTETRVSADFARRLGFFKYEGEWHCIQDAIEMNRLRMARHKAEDDIKTKLTEEGYVLYRGDWLTESEYSQRLQYEDNLDRIEKARQAAQAKDFQRRIALLKKQSEDQHASAMRNERESNGEYDSSYMAPWVYNPPYSSSMASGHSNGTSSGRQYATLREAQEACDRLNFMARMKTDSLVDDLSFGRSAVPYGGTVSLDQSYSRHKVVERVENGRSVWYVIAVGLPP